MHGHVLDHVDKWHVCNGCLPTLTERDFTAVRACGCVTESHPVQICFVFIHTDELYAHFDISISISGAKTGQIKVCVFLKIDSN